MTLENNNAKKVINEVQKTDETLLHLKTEEEFRTYFEEIGKCSLTSAAAYGLHMNGDDLRPKYLIIITDVHDKENIKIVNTAIYSPDRLYNNLILFIF